MRPLSEICQTIRSNKYLAKILPDRLFRSIPVPAMLPGGIGIGFYYYLAAGKPGESKTLFPPIFRIILDPETEDLITLEKAPSIWMNEHDATTTLGYYPSASMQGMNVSEINALYDEYYTATERLIRSANKETVITDSPVFLQWKTLYDKVHEEGFEPYFSTFFPVLTVGEPQNTTGTPFESQPSHNPMERFKQDAVRLMDAMEHVREFVSHLEEPNFKKEWKRIRHLLEAPSFNVVVAGEFNRGKTTLVNKLLGTQLPVGDLPTTALMTQIVHGVKHRLTFIGQSGEKQILELSEASLNALQADNDGNDPKGVLVMETPNSWLGDHRLAVIDTPGAGDLTEHRAEIAAEAVMGADAAMITVCATMPLSLSERVYVEEHVFAKRVPKVAIVITKLDLVPANEQQSVVDSITTRVQSWQPLAEVWLANEEPEIINVINTPVKGIAAIKGAIERWRLEPEHLLFRQRQIRTQLQQLLELAALSVSTRLELAQKDRREIEAENVRLRRAVDAESLGWGDLEIEMSRRSLHCNELLKNQMFEMEKGVCERLQYQLSRTQNPREWWEKDLPFQLSSELKMIHRQLSGLLREHLVADSTWLSNQMDKQYSTQRETEEKVSPILSKPGGVEGIRPDAAQIRDLNQIRTLTRAGMALATVGGYMIFGPFGALVPAFATLATEKGHRTLQTGQIETLSKWIPNLVREMLEKASQEGKENIKKHYEQVVTEIRLQKKRWTTAKIEAIQSSLEGNIDEKNVSLLNAQLKEIGRLLDLLSA